MIPNPDPQVPSEVEGVIEKLKATTLRLTKENKALEEKMRNTVDKYEGQLASQHKDHNKKMNEETEVNGRKLSMSLYRN